MNDYICFSKSSPVVQNSYQRQTSFSMPLLGVKSCAGLKELRESFETKDAFYRLYLITTVVSVYQSFCIYNEQERVLFMEGF